MDHYSIETLNHLNENQLKVLLSIIKKLLKERKSQLSYDREYSTNIGFCYNSSIDEYGTNF